MTKDSTSSPADIPPPKGPLLAFPRLPLLEYARDLFEAFPKGKFRVHGHLTMGGYILTREGSYQLLTGSAPPGKARVDDWDYLPDVTHPGTWAMVLAHLADLLLGPEKDGEEGAMGVLLAYTSKAGWSLQRRHRVGYFGSGESDLLRAVLHTISDRVEAESVRLLKEQERVVILAALQAFLSEEGPLNVPGISDDRVRRIGNQLCEVLGAKSAQKDAGLPE